MSDPGFNRPSHPGHGAGPAGASLSDLLTAAQHIASNIANLAQRYMNAQGETLGAGLTARTLLKQGKGRVAVVSVTADVGSPGPSMIIDAALVTATGPVIASIPAAVGIYVINMPYQFGLVVVPGPGQTLSVSYS